MSSAILIPQFDPDLSGYALKEHEHSQYLTSHQSLTNYATKTYVQQQIAGIDFPDAGVLTFNGRSGAVKPKSGDYTADMVGAAAKSHTHSQYLTAHQSLTNYATKSWVEQKLAEISGGSSGTGAPGTSETRTFTLSLSWSATDLSPSISGGQTVELSGTAVSMVIQSITTTGSLTAGSAPRNLNVPSSNTVIANYSTTYKTCSVNVSCTKTTLSVGALSYGPVTGYSDVNGTVTISIKINY